MQQIKRAIQNSINKLFLQKQEVIGCCKRYRREPENTSNPANQIKEVIERFMEGGIYVKGIFDDKGHLAGFAIEAIKKGTLDEKELLQATAHIAECLYCAEAFSGSFTDSELKKVPSGFSDEIMRRLPYGSEENKIIEYMDMAGKIRVRDNKAWKNKKLLSYSFRVALAVCASLVIIFSGSIDFYVNAVNYPERIKPPEQKLVNYLNGINAGLKDFSQKILNMEVSLNETEEE